MSAGAIAGIAIGVTLATIIVVGLVGWSIWRHKRRSRATNNEQQDVKEGSDTTINNGGFSGNERFSSNEGFSGNGGSSGNEGFPGDEGASGRWQWGQQSPSERHQRPELEDAQKGSQLYEVSGQSRQRSELEGSYQPHGGHELSVESYR